MSFPRRPVRKILLGFLAVMIAIPGATFVWIDRVADRRWEEFGRRLEVLRKEVEARDGRRPVLRGAPEPGNAWEDYVRAFEAYRQPGGKLPPLHELDQVAPPGEIEIVTAHLKANEAVLEQIRSGTRRAIGDFPLQWEEGARCKVRGPYPADEVMRLFRLHARQLVRENMESEAAEVLLDYLQFERDRMNWPAESFLGLRGGVEEDLRMLVVCRPLSAKELLKIERELEILESGLPRAELLLKMDLLAFGYEEVRRPGLGYYSAPGRSLWRYGYSDRIAAVEWYERMERWILSRIQWEVEPWLVARSREAATPADSEWGYFDYSLRQMTYGDLGSIRGLSLSWRLLRVAAHFRATGDWLEVDDPYGTKLLHRIDGRHLRAWSVGMDGIDQGGAGFHGTWNRPIPIPGKPPVVCHDAVIEVTR